MSTRVQPQDKTFNSNGLNLHYLDWGTVGKTPMVLLHGILSHAHCWDDFAAAVCNDYHVLALDQRGRNTSDWAKDGDYSLDAYVSDVAAMCEQLKLEPFVLIGHSMGGRNGMAFTGRYPELVKAFIVVDMGIMVGRRPDGNPMQRILLETPEEFDSFEDAVVWQKTQGNYATMPDSFVRRRLQYALKELPNGKTGWIYDVAIREGLRQRTDPFSEDLWPVVRKFTCPTLLMRGENSNLLNAEVVQQMLAAIPNSQEVEIKRAGHQIYEDNPEDFLTEVKRFLG
jgi:pimeloyl-ACP methyl ester carboxylesterase